VKHVQLIGSIYLAWLVFGYGHSLADSDFIKWICALCAAISTAGAFLFYRFEQ